MNRLSDDIVKQALAQHEQDLRLIRENNINIMNATADHLSNLSGMRLSTHYDNWMASGNPIGISWSYNIYTYSTKWINDQIKNNPAKPPYGISRNQPCFRWVGDVPGYGEVDVLVFGFYSDPGHW